MLYSAIPKLPMINSEATQAYYQDQLGFKIVSTYPDYLIIRKDAVELHFYLDASVDPLTNDSMCYIRATQLQDWYQEVRTKAVSVPAQGGIRAQPWGQREFAIVDLNGNLLTFGESVS